MLLYEEEKSIEERKRKLWKCDPGCGNIYNKAQKQNKEHSEKCTYALAHLVVVPPPNESVIPPTAEVSP